ncbi:MAG: hypothetical protein PHP64_05065 [Actinomycetota bacterium]|nr:hypothetical protein [Actinomycetota bacterium]
MLDEKSLREVASELNLEALALVESTASLRTVIAKAYEIPLTDPVDYYEDRWKTNTLFRFVCTHPDMDHLTGLYRLHEELVSIQNFWDSKHSFTQDESSFKGSLYDVRDWRTYQELRTSTSDPKVLKLERFAEGEFYSDDGIEILAPTTELIELAESKRDKNTASYVLLVKHGKTRVILGGDASKDVWQDIVSACSSKIENVSILKASHHGRDSGFFEDAVKIMKPGCTVVSVGKKPETDASNKYKKYSGSVWSTRWKGNIVFDCDKDGSIKATTQYDR